jgi:hypothetical protein
MFRAFLSFFLLFGLAQNTFGQEFNVSKISKDLKLVTLKNRESGVEATVAGGQEIEGWRVLEITPSEVVVGRIESNDSVILRHMPIPQQLQPDTQDP